MKLKMITTVLLALSILFFIPSCGSDNNSASETETEATQEYMYKSFDDIGFDIKSSWSCEEKPNYLKVTDPDDNSCFEVYSRKIDPAREASDELYAVYGELWASTDCTHKSERKILKNCDIYTCTFTVKETNCNMELYWFEYKDTIYAIYFQKDGKISEYKEGIMNQTITLMKLQKNIEEKQPENPNSDYPHP